MDRKNQRGAGLIEVLVTAFILAVGLLGLALLQTKSLQYNHGAYLRSQATVLASDITDRLRINRQRAVGGDYNVNYGVDPVTGSSLASHDLDEWKNLLTQVLPGGDGAVACVNNACLISVRWLERAGTDAVVASGTDKTEVPVEFTYATRI